MFIFPIDIFGINFGRVHKTIFRRKRKVMGEIMIKGVNRQVVEVRETGCDYFERIIFFVKPEYASISEGKIRERASLIAGATPLPPPTKTKDNKLTGVLKILLGTLCGLAAGITISFLIR
jgi:hypothetical protein